MSIDLSRKLDQPEIDGEVLASTLEHYQKQLDFFLNHPRRNEGLFDEAIQRLQREINQFHEIAP